MHERHRTYLCDVEYLLHDFLIPSGFVVEVLFARQVEEKNLFVRQPLHILKEKKQGNGVTLSMSCPYISLKHPINPLTPLQLS